MPSRVASCCALRMPMVVRSEARERPPRSQRASARFAFSTCRGGSGSISRWFILGANAHRLLVGAIGLAEELPLHVAVADVPEHQQSEKDLSADHSEDGHRAADDDRRPDRDDEGDAIAEEEAEEIAQSVAAVERADRQQ